MTRHIIDVHAHVGKSLGQVEATTLKPVETDVDKLLGLMRRNHIDKALLSPMPGYPRPYGIRNTQEMNSLVSQIIKERPNQFPGGFGVTEPYYGSIAVEEALRIMRDLGLKGLMFHMIFQGFYLDHPLVFSIIEEIAKYDPVFLIHIKEGVFLRTRGDCNVWQRHSRI